MRDQSNVLTTSTIFLAAYTSLILGIAEGYIFPAIVTVPVVIWAVIATRSQPSLLLPPFAAGVLGALAFALAGAELLSGDIEARLLSGAHLMQYLSWIVLIQRKEATQFWLLYALSVLMAGIGAVLSGSVSYGLLLVGFLVLALWNLAAFTLHRAQRRIIDTAEGLDDTESHSKTTFSQMRRASSVLGGISTNAGDRWMKSRFVTGIGGLSVLSVLLGLCFFLLVPRQWIGRIAWGQEGSVERGRSLVGFGETVTLGSFGTLLESTELVMEVQTFDEAGNPIEVEAYARKLGYDVPVFRGHTLDTYQNGEWSRENSPFPSERLGTAEPHAMHQRIRLKPTGTRVLFAMRRTPLRPLLAARMENSDSVSQMIRLDPGSVLRRAGRGRPGPVIEYIVYSEMNARPRERPFGPTRAHRDVPDQALKAQLKTFLDRTVEFQQGDSNRQRADRIVRLLRDSPDYSYTLTIPRREHRDLDPVMEFLEHRKSGHCEFYATALALLLRVDGIPARLVGGFKGGQRNPISGYYEVQQRHAHAWVEAYINGEWVTLDATPAERDASVEGAAGMMGSWEAFRSFLENAWSNYFIDVTYATQSRNVYEPLRRTGKDAWNALNQEREQSASGLERLKVFLSNPSRWFSWQGGLLSFVIMVLAASLVWAAKRLLRLMLGLKQLRDADAHRWATVGFYERFRKLCEVIGLTRQPAQTQREFAGTVATTLRERFPESGTADVPAELVAAFYDVRFGAATLGADRLHEIDGWLSRLEGALGSTSPATTG